MGSPPTEVDRLDREGPQHRVTLTKPFALGKTEITRGQFAAFIKDSGYVAGDECNFIEGGQWVMKSGNSWRNPGYPQMDSHPVACINWDDAQAYVNWLAKKTGKPYRLPSEAEWEYAARAGTTTSRYWGDNPDKACAYANVADRTKTPAGRALDKKHECKDGHFFTAPVGSYKPNAFGLYDMSGNVWEWTEDCWNANYNGAPIDGSAWTTGDCQTRTFRGGAWYFTPRIVRSAFRFGVVPAYRSISSGFRVARMLP